MAITYSRNGLRAPVFGQSALIAVEVTNKLSRYRADVMLIRFSASVVAGLDEEAEYAFVISIID